MTTIHYWQFVDKMHALVYKMLTDFEFKIKNINFAL